MALQHLLGLEDSKKSDLFNNDHDGHDNEEYNNALIPMQSKNDKLKLPNIRDQITGKEISLHYRKGTTCLAFIYQGGLVVCVDSRATGGEFIYSKTVRKVIPVHKYLVGTMAGGAADCSYWLRLLSEKCRLHELKNREPISVAAASKMLANMLYNYKGSSLSLGTMICGWDRKKGPQMFMVDNDARRLKGNLFSVGSGSVYAYGVLDRGYRFDLSDEEAYDLGRRAVFHATHRDPASGGIVRVFTINAGGWKIISEEDNSILYDRYVAEGSVNMNH